MSPTTIPGNLILQSPTANDPLLDLNTQPSLDLQFATGKTLNDRVSGLPLINHQRDASSGKSAGTYVGSDGLIKTSPVNLKTYSNDFTQQWLPLSASILSTNNPDPFGGLTATRVDLPIGSARLQISGTSIIGISTFSVWMRLVSGNDQISLLLQTTPGANTGDVVTVTSEWQRFSTTQNVSSGGGIQIRNSTAESSVIEVFGAQLQEGALTDYIPTTNLPSGAPRFDHDPVTGESLGLLIEESRTNLFTYSEQFDQGWAKTSLSVSANVSASPDGALNADQVTVNSGGGYAYTLQAASINSGSTTTVSVWAKYVNSQYIWLLGGVTPDNFAYFDLINGTVGTTHGYNCTITSNGNGWYRCSATITKTSATGTEEVGFGLTRTDNNPTDNAVGDSVYLWGAQLEAGPFPTSYIPTSGSAVTRAADLASITGTNFSSWYNQSEGTWFTEAKSGAGVNGVFGVGTSTSPVGGLNYDFGGFNAQWQGSVMDGVFNPVDDSFHKFAFTATRTSNTLTADGVQNDTDTATNSLDAIELGLGVRDGYGPGFGSVYLNGHISRLSYYPYRLADATLQEITS